MQIVPFRAASTAFDEVGDDGYGRSADLCLQPEPFAGGEGYRRTICVEHESIRNEESVELARVPAHAALSARRRQSCLPLGPRPEVRGLGPLSDLHWR